MIQKKIIIQKPDGGISISFFDESKFTEDGANNTMLYTEIPSVKEAIEGGLDWFVTEEDIDKSGLESRKQLYWQDDGNGNISIQKDLNWETRLMPDHLVKKKTLARYEADIDSELSAETPDPVVLIEKYRARDIAKERSAGIHNEDSFWVEKAIEGLDNRVSNGESDKPDVRNQLQSKLTELTS